MLNQDEGAGQIKRPFVIYLRLKNAATPEVIETTRLPRKDETIDAWLTSEIELVDQELDPRAGLLWFDSEEVAAISFRRKHPEELQGVHRMPQ